MREIETIIYATSRF